MNVPRILRTRAELQDSYRHGDEGLSPDDVHLCTQVMWDADGRTGVASIHLGQLADLVKRSDKAVRRTLNKLRDLGYVHFDELRKGANRIGVAKGALNESVPGVSPEWQKPNPVSPAPQADERGLADSECPGSVPTVAQTAANDITIPRASRVRGQRPEVETEPEEEIRSSKQANQCPGLGTRAHTREAGLHAGGQAIDDQGIGTTLISEGSGHTYDAVPYLSGNGGYDPRGLPGAGAVDPRPRRVGATSRRRRAELAPEQGGVLSDVEALKRAMRQRMASNAAAGLHDAPEQNAAPSINPSSWLPDVAHCEVCGGIPFATACERCGREAGQVGGDARRRDEPPPGGGLEVSGEREIGLHGEQGQQEAHAGNPAQRRTGDGGAPQGAQGDCEDHRRLEPSPGRPEAQGGTQAGGLADEPQAQQEPAEAQGAGDASKQGGGRRDAADAEGGDARAPQGVPHEALAAAQEAGEWRRPGAEACAPTVALSHDEHAAPADDGDNPHSTAPPGCHEHDGEGAGGGLADAFTDAPTAPPDEGHAAEWAEHEWDTACVSLFRKPARHLAKGAELPLTRMRRRNPRQAVEDVFKRAETATHPLPYVLACLDEQGVITERKSGAGSAMALVNRRYPDCTPEQRDDLAALPDDRWFPLVTQWRAAGEYPEQGGLEAVG